MAKGGEGGACAANDECTSGICDTLKCMKAKVVGVKFKNKDGGDKCMHAPEGRAGAKVKFASCSGSDIGLFWQKRSDGSYESAAHPGLCARKGGGAC